MKQTAVEWLFLMLNNPNKDQEFNHRLLNQAKEMENEQMISFAEFVATYPDKNVNINGEMLHAKSKYDGAERTIDLLETFKSE
jgi:gamma-glutamylcyclotransferase (GGCT)/AIG2-like uncharacterized protein YtfP